MQRFVHAQNLTRYIDLLESETERAKLGQIQKLLIEEVDSVGSLSERIDQVDLLIRHGHARRREQQTHLTAMSDGVERERAVHVLATMDETLQLLADYRRARSDELERTAS